MRRARNDLVEYPELAAVRLLLRDAKRGTIPVTTGPHMPETRMAFEQLADSARLALARGDREGARTSLSVALQVADAAGGISGETADGLIRLGAVYQDAGLAAEAERLFGDAVAVAESTLGPDDAGVVPALTSLGTALVARGANAQAEPLLTRALAIGEARLGADHPDLNIVLNSLSRIYLKQGDFRRAEPLLERLLAMKRSKGEEHPEVATVLASLAAVRQGVGDHEGAEQLARRALHIREATLAPNHFAVASALELLADACAARGNITEALARYQRALAIREQTLGSGHASLRVARERIADLQLQSADAGLDDASRDPEPTHTPIPAPAALTVPTRTVPAAMVVHVEAPRPAVRVGDGDGSEMRQQALVLPTLGGALSLEDEIRNIENELSQAANAGDVRSRIRIFVEKARDALSTRRAQLALVAAASLTLVIAASIAQPAKTADAVVQSSRGAATASIPRDPIETASPSGGDLGRSFVQTSDGSLALHAGSSAAKADVPERQPRPQAKKASRERDEPTPSLDLGRAVHLPFAAIPVPRADSIARASDPAVRLAQQSFSKQFWTNGAGKATDSGSVSSPTNARLIGTMPQPAYPVFLRKNGVEGEVVVQFVVDETGKPDLSTFQVVRSPHEAMTASVRRVVEQLRFEPARTGGAVPKPRTEVVQSSFLFRADSR